MKLANYGVGAELVTIFVTIKIQSKEGRMAINTH